MIKPFVFVLMPFNEAFDDIYKLGIKASCEELNTYCERVDEQIFEENILERIYNQISKADIIISDLSGKNPNVFYETGYAHALGKKVILLTQNKDDIPFDLLHYPHIIYKGKIIQLKKELKSRIEWFIKHPEKSILPNDFNISLFIDGHKLIENNNIEFNVPWDHFHPYFTNAKKVVELKIDICNESNLTFDSNFKIGIITDLNFNRNTDNDNKRVVKLDNQKTLHLSNSYTKIYPNSWESFEIKLITDTDYNLFEQGIDFTLRLFTEFGYKDFLLKLIYHEIKVESEFDL